MTNTPTVADTLPSDRTRFRVIIALVFFNLAFGVLVLIGWFTGLDVLKNPIPGQPPVTPSTAVCFILSSLALFFGFRGAYKLAMVLSATIFCLTCLVALRYVLPISLDLDQLLSPMQLNPGVGFYSGRMTPNTAVGLILLAASLLFTLKDKLRSHIGNVFALSSLLLSSLTIVGYLYQQQQLFGIGIFTPMVLITACSLASQSVGVMLLQPTIGFTPAIFGRGSGDSLARALLPAAIFLPIFLGYMRKLGSDAGWFDETIGVTAVISCLSFLFALLVLKHARAINSLESSFEESHKSMQTFYNELNSARNEAVEAAKSKSSFLANMSHEIRTPMNAVIGCSDMLKRTSLGADQQRLVDIIISSGSALVDIINDILVFSKIESGKFELNQDEIRIVQLVETTADLLADKASTKGLSLTTYIAEDADRLVIGDAQRLRQILLNLLSNAVKFTDQGFINVRVEVEATTVDTVSLRFSVQDTGIGIAEDHLRKLFQPFVQCDGSVTRKFGGTGLGLAISKRLAELMGGTMDVISAEHNGSTFSAVIPLSIARDRASTALPELKGRRMLVVATLYSEYEVIRNYGRLWQMEADYSPDWASALHNIDMALASGAMRKYSVVIMNHHLPGTTIESFSRQIRVRDAQAKSIVLSPITGLPNTLELSLNGVAACLNKPLHQSTLLECLQTAFSLAPEIQDASPMPPTIVIDDFSQALPSDTCKRILVVEDNPVNREVARLQLQELGFAPYVVDNGVEAVDVVTKERLALILMDCQMPVMDGFEATKRIRLLEAATRVHVPIIAMTANAMEGDRETCLAAGMDDYVSKPLTSEKLKEVIEKWMLVAFGGDDDVLPTPPASVPAIIFTPHPISHQSGSKRITPPHASSNSSPHAMALGSGNDLPVLLDELDRLYGRPSSLRLLRMFNEQAPRLLSRLDQALGQNKHADAKAAVHELKGMFSSLRINDMQQLCGQMESLARQKQFGELNSLNGLLNAKFEHWRRLIELLDMKETLTGESEMTTVRIFMIEDNELTRHGLRALLSQTPLFEIVGEATDGRSALDQVLRIKPDLVLVDIGLPDISGIEVTRRIKENLTATKALMFTSHDDEHDMFEAFAAGADGYVVKHDFDRARLELAIRSVASGHCWLDPTIAGRILSFASRRRVEVPATFVPNDIEPLTDEEKNLLSGAETCNGVCSASPTFLQRLHRFADES